MRFLADLPVYYMAVKGREIDVLWNDWGNELVTKEEPHTGAHMVILTSTWVIALLIKFHTGGLSFSVFVAVIFLIKARIVKLVPSYEVSAVGPRLPRSWIHKGETWWTLTWSYANEVKLPFCFFVFLFFFHEVVLTSTSCILN